MRCAALLPPALEQGTLRPILYEYLLVRRFGCAVQFDLSLAQGEFGNHLAVRSLFIEMVFHRNDFNVSWRNALNACAENLQNINISFEWECYGYIYGARSPAEYGSIGPNWRNTLMSDMFVLGKVPLQSATLVISDTKVGQDDDLLHLYLFNPENARRWTLDEKQDWARYVREYILKQR